MRVFTSIATIHSINEEAESNPSKGKEFIDAFIEIQTRQIALRMLVLTAVAGITAFVGLSYPQVWYATYLVIGVLSTYIADLALLKWAELSYYYKKSEDE